jgi:hypothetical protein
MIRKYLPPHQRLLGLGLVLAMAISASAQTSLTPSSAIVNAGKTYQFNLSVASSLLPSTASIQWSIWPPLGTLTSSGLYTAPASVTTMQNTKVVVLIIPASLSVSPVVLHSNITVVPPVSITVSPATATAGPSGTVQLTASVANNSNSAVTWTVSPSVGTVSSSGLYTAPATLSSPTTVTITAVSAADPTKSATSAITLTPSSSAATITMPIEVMGTSSTTQSVQVNVPSSSGVSGPLNLWMQIHGLEYQTQASVKVNNGAWIPINSQTATVQGLVNNYGGIGGAFSTLSMTVSLPAGLVQAGTNTVSFQFNGSDGFSSGFRVLAFNVQLPNGTSLISSSAFAQADPSTWTAPLTDAADITAGQTLWRTGTITQPVSGGSPQTLQAHCGDCHAQDGRDLKYFNYSNNSIYVRSVFHGLNATQANQIVSYIRSLPTPAPSSARPWNPPYQPGPGTDSQPVTNWSAGAGVNAVLASDAAMVPYVSPTMSSADFNPNGNLSVRNTPIAFQLLDWNHWLPRIHPVDSYGQSFTQSAAYADYQSLVKNLVPNNATVYNNNKNTFSNWQPDEQTFQLAQTPASTDPSWSNATTATKLYSVSLWQMVKNWEVNQQFGLEGLAQTVFGPQADSRAWYSGAPFRSSPSINHIPIGSPGIHNGLPSTFTAVSFDWYYAQLVLNNSNKEASCINPIDWGYFYSILSNRSSYSPPQAALYFTMLTKALQISQNGTGPQVGCNGGWMWQANDPSVLVALPNQNMQTDNIFSGLSSTTTATLVNSYMTQWLAAASQYSPQQYYTGSFTTANESIKGGFFGGWAARVYYMIPHLEYQGMSPALAQQIANWAATMWPGNNWNSTVTASCSVSSAGFVGCSTDTY